MAFKNRNYILLALLIILSLSIFLLYSHSEANEKEGFPEKCGKIAQGAKLSPIRILSKKQIEDFMVFPDGNRVVFLLVLWDRYLYRAPDDKYVLLESFPGHRSRYLNQKKAKALISSWAELADQGLRLDDANGSSDKNNINLYAKQMRYYLYTLKEHEWTVLFWEEGEKLFEQRSKDIQLVSPNGEMVLYKKQRKTKKVSALFGLLEGQAHAYEIGVQCVHEQSYKKFDMPFDRFYRWKAQWANNGDSALFCDMTKEFAQRCYLLEVR